MVVMGKQTNQTVKIYIGNIIFRYYKALILHCRVAQLKMITSNDRIFQLDLSTGNAEFN